ncbi:LOW QUALITY PROTEIN: hydrocephalus-inducing protein [Monomorium pharaonis]|uniref:LOW QUALITY PROTEIN: hydrocephalus-inducing protein n=1 Tax=Monomorium pharaonis TaxID=307658 RepID=UPI0017463A24|nr:LOW QUALITY PROTEIN: hydrocephalus-inducing protein [Monomorium pharaonis]
MTPSEYIKQMLMCIQERINYLLKPGRSINVRFLYDNCESRCFRVSPSIVVFQRFIPGNLYNVTLTVRNVTKVRFHFLNIALKMSRHLKLSRDPDPFFSIEYHGSNYSTMVAPGLVHIYNVRFSPTEKRDYQYRVEFINDTEIFAVPVIAIGPRPILDIPDRIEIPATAVKIPSSRTILVRNVGDAPAIFNPKYVNYKLTGEKLCLTLRSSAINSTIRLDRGSIRMEDTYLGLSRSKVLTIHNRSDYVVKFQWMRFKDNDTDVQRKEEYEGEIWPQSSADITKTCITLSSKTSFYLGISSLILHPVGSLRGTGKGPVFHLNVITIDLSNIFLCSVHNYEVSLSVNSVVYKNFIKFIKNFYVTDLLNFYNTFLRCTFLYCIMKINISESIAFQIVAANNGYICGTLIYKARQTDFGGTINITPCTLTLKPDEYKSFNLSFSSNRKGDFIERIDFIVKESLEVLSLHIKGCVICPTLHFDKRSLDFGENRSFVYAFAGFSRSQEISLRNLSLVPVTYSVSIMEDGDQAPLTYEEFAISEVKPSFPTNPREFTITPQKGVVQAHSSLKLKVVSYTANVVQTGRANMRVDMWDSDSNPVILPLSFCGAIPSLSIKPAEINIRFSFINFPYTRFINVENGSDLDGYFYIVPQAISKNIPIIYSLSCYQGFLKARQSKTIDVTIITKNIGRQTTALNMLTMGEPASVTSCQIICNGQGPVISAQPTCLNFGEILVLQEKIMNFHIINDSPIPAQFKLTSPTKKSSWLVNPTFGEVEPNKSAEITIKLFLRDTGKYTDNIIVHAINSRSFSVNIIATGIGCSVVFEPQIFPIFDMGFLFSHQNLSIPITIKNFGTRNCQIIWSNNPEVRYQKSQTWPKKFKIEPCTVEIPANSYHVVQCKICWNVNETLVEDWYVFEQILGQGKRKLIGTSTFKATFTEPRIVFNKRELTFRIDIHPEGEKLQQTDELIVTNQSQLNLNVLLYIDAPFYLMSNKKKLHKKNMVLMDGTTTTIPIKFLPNINPDNPYSQNYNSVLWFEYDEHPNKVLKKYTLQNQFALYKNFISLISGQNSMQGAVNFPNITLLSKDMFINCISGSTAKETLRITNNGPIPVIYKFLWAGESIEIQRGTHNVRTEMQQNMNKLQDSDSENRLIEVQSETLDETLEKLRNIFMSTETSYPRCLDDPEILALIDPNLELPTKDLLDDILDIIPHEGILVPHSSQYVRFIFHASEPMQVKVAALCEILQGPTEVVNVFASADVVQYSVDKQVIDFGQQASYFLIIKLFGELCRSNFTLENHSMIYLDYKINQKNLISKRNVDVSTIGVLTIDPNNGFIDPLSTLEITVEFQPMLLGAFEIEFELQYVLRYCYKIIISRYLIAIIIIQVTHADPLIITAKGITSYPQVYPYISRDISKQYSAELGYQAIQLLSLDYIIMKKQEIKTHCNTNNDKSRNQIPEWDERILLNNGWDLISYEEIFPSIVDIEMSIDRLLANQFIKENNLIIQLKYPTLHKNTVIPYLYTPGYIIGICSRKNVNYFKINSVSRGSTIPIIIKGVITYPFVIVNTELLDFQNVIVGECLMMKVLCRVKANLEIFTKTGLETQIVTLLGRGIEYKLQISDLEINFSPTILFTEVLEKEFTIENTSDYPVEFFWHHLDRNDVECTLLNKPMRYSLFLEEERIAEALTRYYGVKEILLPPRKLGERMPSSLMEFYNNLMSEMANALSAEVIEEKSATALDGTLKILEIKFPFTNHNYDNELLSVERKNRIRARKKSSSTSRLFVQQFPTRRRSKIKKEFNVDRRKRKKSTGYSSTSTDTAKRDCPSMSVLSEHDFPREPPILPTNDPEELHNLLLCYIETLRKDPSFHARIKDPVKELFDSQETKSISELDPSQSPMKVCIIFHGAPFTEYQETACRSAKALQVPLLCIDNVIIKGIALGDNYASIKLRQIIDDAYQEYLLAFERLKLLQQTILPLTFCFRDNLKTDLTAKKTDVEIAEHNRETIAKESSKQTKSPKSPRLPNAPTKFDLKTTEVDGHSESDTPTQLMISFEMEFAKIPRKQDLTFLDPISVYEYKIQTILLLQEIFSHYTTIEPKVSKKDQNDTFLGIEIDLLIKVLEERYLSSSSFSAGSKYHLLIKSRFLMSRLSSDFKDGFVLQTLNNVFLKNDIITLLTLLNIIGHVEYSLFVTFLNSMNTYTRKMEELRKLEGKSKLSQQVSTAQTTKNKKIKTKNQKNNREDKSQTFKTLTNKEEIRDYKEFESRDSKSILEKQEVLKEVSNELQNINNAMNDYYNRLSVIENIIQNWDPLKKNALFKDKSLKTDRLIDTKDKNSDVNKENVLLRRSFQIVSLSTLSNSDLIMEINSSRTSVISKQENSVRNTKRKERIFNKNKEPLTISLNASARASIESIDTNVSNINTIFEKILKPRWILQPNKIQKFKIRYQPEEEGIHRRTYALSILNGYDITYDINVYGVTDVPRLDMNPNIIFSKAGQCEFLKISAGVTKLGSFTDKLYVCIANNPHIEIIELRCNGSKLDIELENKHLSFGHVLLHRRNFLNCFIRNRSPIEIFWQLDPELLDSQISVTPTKGIVKTHNDQKIEFCYYANKLGTIEKSLIFKAFFHEDDLEPIFTETVTLSGETYDVAVDINYANPIDLKCVKVGSPTSADFTISNRGNYEVKYTILLEEQSKLAKIAPTLLVKLHENLEINPAFGFVQPRKEAVVQYNGHNRCFRVRIYPGNEINFSSLGICTKKTLYLNVENIGQFPLHYFIKTAPIRHPSVSYMTEIKTENVIKKDHDKSTDTSMRKDKSRIEKSDDKLFFRNAQEFTTVLKIGPFTVTKTEGYLQPKEIDAIAIECFPEFVGSQEEDIIILVPDSVPEVKKDKLIKLSVNSSIPSVDLQDLDAVFHENHIVDRIEDFTCPKEVFNFSNKFISCLHIGAHTVFARQEKCLYFRYVNLFHIHTTYFVLHNRNVIPADVELTLLADSFTPKTMKSNTFILTPERERIPPMSHKRFAISFNPTLIEACYAVFEIAVELPPHLQDEKFSIKLVGQACVPEVTIIEPPSGKRERTILNFGRTLVDNFHKKRFTFKNIGVIPAKVIVEIYEDPNCLFTFNICEDTRNLSSGQCYKINLSNDQYIVVRLMPEETRMLEVKFTPREIGKYESQVRLFIADNPYENLIIDLKGEAYTELIVLDGLELTNTRLNSVNERRESKSRRSSKPNSTAEGNRDCKKIQKKKIQKYFHCSLLCDLYLTASTPRALPISLIYKLDYGYCFVNKIYRKNFKVVNKSMNWYLRFQWSSHPNVVFTPSIGHLKPQTYKEIVATFLSSEPTIYIDVIFSNDEQTLLECTVCAIDLADPLRESSWDDRETEVRWIAMNSNGKQEINTEMAKKIIESVNEPSNEVVPGTMKCIQVLFNATVAYSKYSCSIKEINFKNTLMFQVIYLIFMISCSTFLRYVYYKQKVKETIRTRTLGHINYFFNNNEIFNVSTSQLSSLINEYTFTFSNTGTVDVKYAWQINMDEHYPMRSSANYSRATPRSRRNDARPTTALLTSRESSHQRHNPNFDGSVKLNRRQLLSPREIFPDNLIEVKPIATQCIPSDLFSSSAGLTGRSSDSWLESNDLPFTIHPEKGILAPGESVECVLRFSPMDVFDYKAYLACKMENLDPELPELVIPIVGRSLLPYCHFDIPESDYLSGDRRDTKLPGPIGYQPDDNSLPEGTRVIELDVIGIGGSHVKKFRMINPTSDDYRFAWEDRTSHVEGEIPKFHCVLPKGIAEKRKQVDFAFTFLAEDVGTFESFWLFRVEKYNLEYFFLFVAMVREPSVCCSIVHLKMRPTVNILYDFYASTSMFSTGVNVRESASVINNEEFQIPFQITRDSLYSEGRLQCLKITPMSGTLPAKGKQIFWIEYQPTLLGEFQFFVKWVIKRMKAPLTIFVTTTTYDIIVSVTYVDQNGQIVRLNQDKENVIDYGKNMLTIVNFFNFQLMLRVPVTITFEITNSSKMTLSYSWDLGMTSEIISRNMYTITMPQKQDHVLSESHSNCSLIVTALQKTVIKNHPVFLKISRGPTYRLILKATANKPILEFSFNYYDFGPCYIRDVTATPYHVDLRITNSDNVPYILECKFEEKPHISVDLNALSETITARSSIIIPITFRPLEQVHYRDNLNFIINSTIEKKITITGEGITYKVRLVNPHDKSVDLGNLPINKMTSRKVPVINEGRAALELKFDLMKNLPGYDRFRERIRTCPRKIDQGNSNMDHIRASISETKRSYTFDVNLQTIEPDLSEVLRIEPTESIVLQPGKIANVVVKYKSTRRMRPFIAKVAFQTNSMIQPLFILRGSCIGAEFRLSRTYIPFGIVVQGCLSEAKVVLLNMGDIGARFKWNTLKLPGDFSIVPATGYCSPGMDVNFVVSFRPTRHDSLIEGNATLEIERYGDLGVNITGASCKLPDPVDTLFFSCCVREKTMRSLNIENDTATSWKLKPEITGDCFFVDEVLHVPAKESATCTITYAPLVMNSEGEPHEGTLLLKLPDDKAPLVYCLRGLSLPPQALQRITRQFPAKTKYTELLPVYNWLGTQQRFECKIENMNGNEPVKNPKVFTFVGNSKIDVPANGQRDYRAEFHSYKESRYNFKVTFANEEGEYQFYELQYDITRPQKIESIKLITTVRYLVCHTLRLNNPLKDQHVTYTAKCQHPCITIYDVPKLVAPLHSVSYQILSKFIQIILYYRETIGIEYYPLHPAEEVIVALDINCEELGLFPYELQLRAIPASAEKTTRVVAVLGGSITFSLTINNHARKTAVFTIKVNNECFTTPKNIEVPAMNSATFDVTYEPNDVDNASATLTATSEIAGEFVFPLIGTYSLPKPQGPYTVTANAPASIPFKNIFRESKSFELFLDNPEVFATSMSLNKIKPKQVFLQIFLLSLQNDNL